jgi:hypothetical protein
MKKFLYLLRFILLLPIMPILGALNIKPIDAATTKWQDNASRAAAECAANAEAAADTWARNTAAAADNYGQSISAAGIKNRFRAGVVKAGAAKFARKVKALIPARFSGGVSEGAPDYKLGAEPYYLLLASLTLPTRKPAGDPANLARVDFGNKALHAKRLAMLGGGG